MSAPAEILPATEHTPTADAGADARTVAPPRPSGWFAERFSALTSPNFSLFFQGTLVTQIGMWMQQVAFGWLVLTLTDSPFYLGLTAFFRALPMLVVSPFGGVLADRLDRRQILLQSQLGTAVISGGLAFLVAIGQARPWHLLVASFLMGAAMAVNMPARQAMVGQLVTREQLPNAIALNSMSMNSSRVIGPALAGGLIGIIGIGGCLFLHAGAYLWSVVNVVQIKVPAVTRRAASASVVQNLIEGFRYCYEQKSVFGMLLMAVLVSVFGMQYMQLLPALARDVLGMGADGFGLLMTATGAGAIAGSVFIAASSARSARGTFLLVSAIAYGASLCVLSFVRAPALAMLLLAFAGASSAVLMALNQTIIQQVVPDHLRGRVMSVYLFTFGLMPLGTLPAGWIAEIHGTPVSIFLGGLICYVGALWVYFFRPGFRQI